MTRVATITGIAKTDEESGISVCLPMASLILEQVVREVCRAARAGIYNLYSSSKRTMLPISRMRQRNLPDTGEDVWLAGAQRYTVSKRPNPLGDHDVERVTVCIDNDLM